MSLCAAWFLYNFGGILFLVHWIIILSETFRFYYWEKDNLKNKVTLVGSASWYFQAGVYVAPLAYL